MDRPENILGRRGQIMARRENIMGRRGQIMTRRGNNMGRREWDFGVKTAAN